MLFRPDGSDIPDELVALQEKGDTVFVCGAGVSRMVGLPSFRGLVESVYNELGEDWRQHPAEREVMEKGGQLANQYDRLLRILERRLGASDLSQRHGIRERIRGAVRRTLVPPDRADLSGHLLFWNSHAIRRGNRGSSRPISTRSSSGRGWSSTANPLGAMPTQRCRSRGRLDFEVSCICMGG